MEFLRQEYWSGLSFPSPGDLPNPGFKPRSPALASRFFTTEPPGKLLFFISCSLSHISILSFPVSPTFLNSQLYPALCEAKNSVTYWILNSLKLSAYVRKNHGIEYSFSILIHLFLFLYTAMISVVFNYLEWKLL